MHYYDSYDTILTVIDENQRAKGVLTNPTRNDNPRRVLGGLVATVPTGVCDPGVCDLSSVRAGKVQAIHGWAVHTYTKHCCMDLEYYYCFVLLLLILLLLL